MSFEAGSISSKLGLDVSGFAGGMLQATSIASIFPSTVAAFLANPLLGVVSLAGQAAGALADAFKQGVSLYVDFEQAEISFGVLLGSAERAKLVLSDLSDFAAATPFEMPDLVGASRKLLAFGVTAEQLIPTLTSIGDVSAGIGAPVGEIAEIFGKAKVQGTLFAEDINQLVGRGIPVIQEFAKQLGVSEGEVKKLASQGKVNFDMLQKAFESLAGEGGKFGGMMEKQSHSLGGLWSTLKDTVNVTLRGIAEQVIEALDIKGGIGGMIEGIEGFGATMMDVVGQAMKVVGPLLKGVWELFKGMGGYMIAVLVPVFKTLLATLEPFAVLLGSILEMVGKAMQGIASVVSTVTDALGMTDSSGEERKKKQAEEKRELEKAAGIAVSGGPAPAASPPPAGAAAVTQAAGPGSGSGTVPQMFYLTPPESTRPSSLGGGAGAEGVDSGLASLAANADQASASLAGFASFFDGFKGVLSGLAADVKGISTIMLEFREAIRDAVVSLQPALANYGRNALTSGGEASPAAGSVVIESLHVHGVDPEETSTRIAQKVAGEVKPVLARADRERRTGIHAQQIAEVLGGGEAGNG